MAKRALVHSIHSQVPNSLFALKKWFDLIISLDSHMDISLGADGDFYPEELKLIARRTTAHTSFRHMFGELPLLRKQDDLDSPVTDIVVAISESCLATHALLQKMTLDEAQVKYPGGENPIDYYSDFVRKTYGIEVYASPPNNMMSLMPRVKGTDSWLLDIDVDFMYDMQGECYSPIRNAKPGELQWMTHVIQFIQKSMPETITISEAKVAAIRNPDSHFGVFVRKLKSLGYVVEERKVFGSDDEVVKGIAICDEFYRTVSKGLMIQYLGDDFDASQKAEESAAKTFFRSKGYDV